jgi:hypothetical protein
MAKRATQRQTVEQPEFPATLIPPGEAQGKDRSAYWIGLLANLDDLKAATETTDFFELMQEFPAAVWDRLAIYLYRLPDDSGMLIKNSDEKPHYIKILRQPLTEEFVAKIWGGGKYQAYLKIDNKEVLRKHTFRIDGDPKVQPGQRVEIDGKAVPINGAAPAATADSRSDLATVIEASASANKQNMEILAEGSKAAIQLVRDQAANAAKPDASSGLMDKMMTALIDRLMNPPAPADPIDTFVKLQGILNKNPETAPEAEDPPLEKAMTLMEKVSGKSFSELVKGSRSATAAPESAWAPFAPVALQFVTSLPTIMSEVRQTRQLEMQTKDLEFRRAVWLRTAQPGAQPPPELLANNPAPQNHAATPAERQPQPQPQPGNADPMQLANVLVQMICHGFDKNPRMGYQTAATIDFTYGDAIEALGLEKFLADEAALAEYVQGLPALAERSRDARWAKFQSDFLDYTTERWPAEGDDQEETADPAKGPQPVA